jgi:hypothetical protein
VPVEYTQKHGGCAIVCGSAPSLHDDLAKAKELRPGATILGANLSARFVSEIEHIWTLHNEGVDFLKKQIDRKVFVHTRPRKFINGGGLWFVPAPDRSWNEVDYYWPSLYWLNGSSGPSAALWAKHGMGFDEVIMAGIQLSTDSQHYIKGYIDPKKEEQDRFADENTILHYQACMIAHKENGKYDGIYGMSGFPRGLLGAPPGLED